MQNYIYCKSTSNNVQTFYLMVEGVKYFLFKQSFKKSNKEAFQNGVYLFDLGKLRKSKNYDIRKTATKLPVFIRNVEREHGFKVLKTNKNKQYKKGNERSSYYYDEIM